jgi:putative tricarboxylic transport membrane protein
MRKYQFPIPATVLGVILGPIAEKNLRLALMHSGGDILPFFTRPICLIIIALTLFSLFISLRLERKTRKTASGN